ncbi:MAG TPA: flagellin [Thermotogota bacterium]|nr:flagellin [Thermotogota bacterium]
MIVSHSAVAFSAWRQVTANREKMSTHLERLSSALRINRGADDAAGLAISEKMRSLIRGLGQAVKNAQDGISMVQSAEGALQETHAVLQRMRELFVQAANGTYTMKDREDINDELQQLKKNLDEIAHHSEFNNQKLLDGSASLFLSTSSDKIQAISGEIQPAKIAASSLVEQSSGAFRLDMEIGGGQGQIQNSHVYTQLNGTLSGEADMATESGKNSGLTSFHASGLKEESYLVESREVPLGGIYYVDRSGSETLDPNTAIGISSMNVTPAPDLVAFGEYEITPAQEVPFMAIFDDYETTDLDLIRGVDPTGRDGIDVRMHVQASQSHADAQTQVAWTDIGGAGSGTIVEDNPASHSFAANLAYQTDAAFDTNLYSHFQVEAVDSRDLLQSEIQAVTSYVSETGSEMEMELTYKSEAGAQVNMGLGYYATSNSLVNMELTYQTEASSRMNLELDYQASAASQVAMELTYQTAPSTGIAMNATYSSRAGEEVTIRSTYELPPTYQLTITPPGLSANLGSMDIEQARNELASTFSGENLDFSVANLGDGTRRIVVQNNRGEEISISDNSSDELGLAGLVPIAGQVLGTALEYQKDRVVNVESQDIQQIGTSLDTAVNPIGIHVSAMDSFDGTYALRIENTGRYQVEILSDGNGDSVESELGLNAYGTSLPASGVWDSTVHVFHDHTFSTTLANPSSLVDLASAMQADINAQSASGASISGATFSTTGGTSRQLQFSNHSMYRFAFSDTSGGTWTQLGIGALALERGGTISSNSVYHNYTLSIDTAGKNLGEIRDALQTALQNAVDADGIANTNTSDTFLLQSGTGGLDRILVNNSGTANTSYQITLSDNTGLVIDQLGLSTPVQREENFVSSNQVYHAYSIDTDVGGRNQQQVVDALQARLNLLLAADGITPNPNTASTFIRQQVSPGLSRIGIQNSGTANTHYRIGVSDHTGTAAAQLNLVSTVDPGDQYLANQAHHEHVLSVNVSNMDLPQIAQSLQTTLSSALNSDQIVNTQSADTFVLEQGVPGLDRILIRNSGLSNTSYTIALSDQLGNVASQLGLQTTVERANDFLGSAEVYNGHVVTETIGDMNLEEIRAHLQSALDTLLALDGIDPNTNTANTFVLEEQATGLWRIRIRNTNPGNTSYSLSISDQVGTTAAQLGMDVVVLPQTSVASHHVHHEHTLLVEVGDRDIEEIRSQLQDALQTAMNADGIVDTNSQESFLRVEDPPGSGRHRIDLDNTLNRNTSYQIAISDHAGGLVANQLGIHATTNRASSHNGTARDYLFDWGGVATSARNIEQLRDQMDGHALFSANWIDEPDYTGQNYGRYQITNTGGPDAANEMRRVTLQSSSGTGATQLLGGPMVLRWNATGQTQTWQARDQVRIHVQYQGMKSSGETVSGSRTDWWWEGEQGDRNPLASDPDLGFASLKVPDNVSNATELSVGDSWTLFTRASGKAGHDRLDFQLEDGQTASDYGFGGTGARGGGSFCFDDGVLDNASMHIPQTVRSGIGTQSTFTHNIQFGNAITSSNDAVVFKERYQASYDHYAHAYYGDETTYFFENKGDWRNYIQNVKVWRQEDSNMSLLFTVLDGGRLSVEGKGYHRDGSVADFDPIEMTIPSGGPITIGSVRFEDLSIGGNLTTGDKFVVNVAARAGNANSATTHGDLSESDTNIAIRGNPFRVMESSMQYRFDSGATNGRELSLLGYFVHPIMGGMDSGCYTGTINVGVGGSGFATGTHVDESQKAVVAVNYLGRFDHYAGALINDFHFHQLGSTEPIKEVIDSVEYHPQSRNNGSVLFEVLQANEDTVLLRAQAHLYDVDGKYRYEEDDFLLLGKDNTHLNLFEKEGFEGLTFTEFHFGDLTKLRAGDVFTLTLSANAEEAGENFDELFLFSEKYPGSMYPMGWRFRDRMLDQSSTTLKTFQVGGWNDPLSGKQREGCVYEGQMTFGFQEFHGGSVEGVLGNKNTPRIIEDTLRFDSVYRKGFDAGTANRHTRLADIAEFYDDKGGFLLEKPQYMQILYGDKQHTLSLNPHDRLLDVMDRINQAMYVEFGQKELVQQDQRYKFAYFTDHSMDGSQIARPQGTFMIQSALEGKLGEVVLSGNSELVRALGMHVVRESQESDISMTIRDAFQGTILKEKVKSTTNQVVSLANDPRFQFKVSAEFGDREATYDENRKDFIHDVQQATPLFLHVLDRANELQIGAKAGQSTLFRINRMDSQGLGLKGVHALTRESAGEGIRKVDRASAKVSSQRTMLGALQGRLEKTIHNLGVAAENLTQGESQVRDANMAQEFLLLAKQQILTQVAQAMLSQANTLFGNTLELLRGM